MKKPVTLLTGLELPDIIANIDFRSLVTETHTLNHQHKTLCPFHQDSSPSCHIYDDGFHCYACGAHGDALDWYQQVHSLTKADAIKALSQRVGATPTAQRTKPVGKSEAKVKACTAKPLSDALHVKYWQRLEQLQKSPREGFTVDDCKALGIAASGDDAVLAVTDPLGNIVTFKQRRHTVSEGQSRYFYLTKDCGTPAWCSPSFFTSEKVLIVEGELNAMACALVRHNMDEDLAVMGVAGVNGQLWLGALKDKIVYCYADGDAPGQAARDRWAVAAIEAGAKRVFRLEPLPDLKDFCDVVGNEGRDALREVLSCLH
jgi:DNA primase